MALKRANVSTASPRRSTAKAVAWATQDFGRLLIDDSQMVMVVGDARIMGLFRIYAVMISAHRQFTI